MLLLVLYLFLAHDEHLDQLAYFAVRRDVLNRCLLKVLEASGSVHLLEHVVDFPIQSFSLRIKVSEQVYVRLHFCFYAFIACHSHDLISFSVAPNVFLVC